MLKASCLKTEYLKDPIGIDITQPRLMWLAAGSGYQSAYEIKLFINDAEYLLGPVTSNNMRHQLHEHLKSRDRVEWQVRLTDDNGMVGAWSDTVFLKWLCSDRMTGLHVGLWGITSTAKNRM